MKNRGGKNTIKTLQKSFLVRFLMKFFVKKCRKFREKTRFFAFFDKKETVLEPKDYVFFGDMSLVMIFSEFFWKNDEI